MRNIYGYWKTQKNSDTYMACRHYLSEMHLNDVKVFQTEINYYLLQKFTTANFLDSSGGLF